MSMEQETSRFHNLNDEWLDALEKVQRLDGFQDFLRPSRLSTLQGAAINGPVVILNASQSGSDAMIVTLSGVKHIALPDLSFTAVNALVKLTQTATVTSSRTSLLPDAHIEHGFLEMPVFSGRLQHLRLTIEARHAGRVSDAQMDPEDTFRVILASLWIWAVEPVIRSLDLEVN
jgi:hypothetical protein